MAASNENVSYQYLPAQPTSPQSADLRSPSIGSMTDDIEKTPKQPVVTRIRKRDNVFPLFLLAGILIGGLLGAAISLWQKNQILPPLQGTYINMANINALISAGGTAVGALIGFCLYLKARCLIETQLTANGITLRRWAQARAMGTFSYNSAAKWTFLLGGVIYLVLGLTSAASVACFGIAVRNATFADTVVRPSFANLDGDFRLGLSPSSMVLIDFDADATLDAVVWEKQLGQGRQISPQVDTYTVPFYDATPSAYALKNFTASQSISSRDTRIFQSGIAAVVSAPGHGILANSTCRIATASITNRTFDLENDNGVFNLTVFWGGVAENYTIPAPLDTTQSYFVPLKDPVDNLLQIAYISFEASTSPTSFLRAIGCRTNLNLVAGQVSYDQGNNYASFAPGYTSTPLTTGETRDYHATIFSMYFGTRTVPKTVPSLTNLYEKTNLYEQLGSRLGEAESVDSITHVDRLLHQALLTKWLNGLAYLRTQVIQVPGDDVVSLTYTAPANTVGLRDATSGWLVIFILLFLLCLCFFIGSTRVAPTDSFDPISTLMVASQPRADLDGLGRYDRQPDLRATMALETEQQARFYWARSS